MFQLQHVAAQTAPHDAALLCTSIPAVATAQSPTKPLFWKSLLALVSGSMLNQDTLLVQSVQIVCPQGRTAVFNRKQ